MIRSMIRATNVRGQHHWTQPPADTVVLDFDDRHRRRMVMTGTRGLEFLLDLENAVALRGGDALVLEDGRLIEVVAAPEPLIEIRTDPHHLVRVAWHLGNRHLPTQIMAKGLRIRRDHVIEAMVKGLGARVIEIEAPFDPEGGAYAGGGHAHAESDAHATSHAHAQSHAHAHAGHDHSSHDHSSHDHGSHDHSAHAHSHAHSHGDHQHDEHCDHDHHHGHSHAHDHK
jgi:urease accessory protein